MTKFSEKHLVGATVKGKVERREVYGIFVRLEDGPTGLLPKSKAVHHPEFPYDKLKVGDEVTVQIDEIRELGRAYFLGCSERSWKRRLEKLYFHLVRLIFRRSVGLRIARTKLQEALAKKKS